MVFGSSSSVLPPQPEAALTSSGMLLSSQMLVAWVGTAMRLAPKRQAKIRVVNLSMVNFIDLL